LYAWPLARRRRQAAGREVEDHPLDYRDFEGATEDGMYHPSMRERLSEAAARKARAEAGLAELAAAAEAVPQVPHPRIAKRACHSADHHSTRHIALPNCT
jgi:hypothetical protein